MTSPDIYYDFARSLTDAQLDAAYRAAQDAEDNNAFEFAIIGEYEARERITKLSFYTPHLTAARATWDAEFLRRDAGKIYVIGCLDRVRLFPGCSLEIEAQLKILMKELIEQL